MNVPNETMTKLEEKLWKDYLAEARKYHKNTNPCPNLKEHIRKHIGHKITEIDKLTDSAERTKAILGARVCVRSGGYVSAMYARNETPDLNELTITESAYDNAFEAVRTIYHGIPGDRLCVQPSE